MRGKEQELGRIDHNEWKITMKDALHERPRALVDAFYVLNPKFKKRVIAFRENAALEYEGVVQAFVGDVNELNEMPNNPSLWVVVGVMTNAGDFVTKYVPVEDVSKGRKSR